MVRGATGHHPASRCARARAGKPPGAWDVFVVEESFQPRRNLVLRSNTKGLESYSREPHVTGAEGGKVAVYRD